MTLTEEQRGTVGFDLEKARASIAHYRIENPSNADTESALKELVDQANLAEDALAEIERLRGYEIAARDLSADLTKVAGDRDEHAARIKELEDAHKRSGKKYAKIINELRSSVYANIPGLDVGKIGPDATKPRSWQITDERKATLSASLKVLERLKKNNTDTDHSYLDRGITVLRAMLREAEQCE